MGVVAIARPEVLAARSAAGALDFESLYAAHARYVSGDLVAAIARTIVRVDPDWIVLPTPLDNHPDHCATFAFVLAALRSLRTRAGAAATMPERLLTYLVHTSQGWPPPPSVSGPLPEPPKVLPTSRWYALALDDAAMQTKLAALRTHRTQAAVMETLFRSFTRPNELFAVLDRAAYARLTPGTPVCGPSLSVPSPEPSPGSAS